MKKGNLSIIIDDLTECLVDRDGNEVDTVAYQIHDVSLLNGLNKRTGWYVNWKRLYKRYDIYALAVKSKPKDIQGLVAVADLYESGVTLINWAVAAPNNNPLIDKDKDYVGVGGHLFAIALYSSLKAGFGGVVVGHPSNEKLQRHYIDKLHAKEFKSSALSEGYQYTIVLEGEDARWLYEKYGFEIL